MSLPDKYPQKSDSQLNRRSFLSKAFLLGAGPSIIGVSKLTSNILKNRQEPTLFVRRGGFNFTNIGVEHDTKYIVQHVKDILGNLLINTDILALELSNIPEKNSNDDYFGLLALVGKDENKTVIPIDNQGKIGLTLNLIFLIHGSGLLLLNILREFLIIGKNDDKKELVRKKYLNTVLLGLGLKELSIDPIIPKIAESYNPENRGMLDISYIGDARTIFMTMEILKIMKENPDKKILSITGDYHANMIGYYIYDAQGQREFKNILYNIVYGIFKILP